MKRFVSYLYSIYNNQKIHNAGFARIELRKGRNRVDIHLKENGYSGKTGTVYLFIRKQEIIQGIPIGNITFRNNQADFRYEQAEENIGQTSWQIMQMNGILLLIDNRVAFLSQWDEQPVDTTRFEVWNADGQSVNGLMEKEPKEESSIEKASSTDRIAAGNTVSDDEHLVSKDPGSIDGHSVSQSTVLADDRLDSDRPIPSTDRLDVKKTAKTQESQDDRGITDVSDHQDDRGTAAASDRLLGGDAALSGKEPSMDASLSRSQSDGGETVLSGKHPADDGVPLPDNESKDMVLPAGQTSDVQTAELQLQPENQWNQIWRHMLRTYPVLDQFTDKDHVLCVRIEIKDVRLLPEKYWSMVNNSFLLHGFFNYRYMAFGRIGQNWFIGIPGVYQNQEHVMASVFGFPDFLPQKQQNEGGEQPGYWYRILEI